VIWTIAGRPYYIKSSQGIINLSKAIVNQALNDLPDSKSFFVSGLFQQIVTDIDINPDKLMQKFNLSKEPKWISQLEKRLIYNEMLPVEWITDFRLIWIKSSRLDYI